MKKYVKMFEKWTQDLNMNENRKEVIDKEIIPKLFGKEKVSKEKAENIKLIRSLLQKMDKEKFDEFV